MSFINSLSIGYVSIIWVIVTLFHVCDFKDFSDVAQSCPRVGWTGGSGRVGSGHDFAGFWRVGSGQHFGIFSFLLTIFWYLIR